LFYRDGLRAVGIDTILAEAGVAKMTLYNHFASKEELIIAILEKRDVEFRASLMATVDAAGTDPAKRLLAVFDWLEGWFAGESFKGCVFIRAVSEFPEPTHPIHQTAWRHKVAVKAALTDLSAATGAKDPAALAEALSFVIDGAIVTAHATQTTAPARSARATAAQLITLAAA
jgi:AcrR family transcriptional regulator